MEHSCEAQEGQWRGGMTTRFDFPLAALIAFSIGFLGLAYGLPL
jgi:hypothetical protein